MKLLKNPMTNAIYIASITAIYAMIFIVSSEFVLKYVHLLSNSWWSLFIQSKNMKFLGLGMIIIAIIIDTLSALRRKKYDEYQIIALEKIILFNGLFLTIIFPLSLLVLIFIPMYFVETIFALILFQWIGIIITETIYLFKNYKM
jgi:hypothetical protein